ncbi:MAG: DegV family protein [Coriobacteriales bacterium]|jgi:DegV family protein with EDD domain|nr:DegV family protein [Coriobacteriales bacterium]
MGYVIITDSSANLLDSYIEKNGLIVLSLEFIVDGVSYRGYTEGEITDNKQFYSMMREGKVVKTSLVGISEVDTVLRSCFDRGEDVLYLGFDSAISGSYEAASTYMAKIQAESYPERRLRCVDTLAAALGEGLLVAEAVKKKAEGMGLDELADWTEANRLHIAHWFTVDDLNYLQRGGRLSKGTAIAGTLLNIKPVLHVDVEGRLVPVSKVRGRRKSIQALYERFAETAREPRAEQPVYISHGDCPEDAQQLADLICSQQGVTEVVINDLDPVIGAHAGPGTLALFFLTDVQR